MKMFLFCTKRFNQKEAGIMDTRPRRWHGNVEPIVVRYQSPAVYPHWK
jgi:hypothetical protein